MQSGACGASKRSEEAASITSRWTFYEAVKSYSHSMVLGGLEEMS